MNKILSIVALALVIVVGTQLTHAQTATNLCTSGVTVTPLTGWAWSSNIGWISFNSTNPNSGGGTYQVCVDADGDMGGYAWSSNIGWVSFEPGDLTGCPSAAPAQVNLSTGASRGTVSGWARALAGKGRTDGWEGCIELAGTNHASSAAGQGVRMNPTTGAFTGYAWGSDVVGWVDFNSGGNEVICTNNCGNGTTATAPTCTLTPNRTTVPAGGGPVVLTWNSANATACTGSGFATGNAVSGNTSVNVTTNSNFSLSCVNADYPTPQYCAVAAVTVGTPTSGITLNIGRTVASANSTALAITKGDSFALKWSNNAPEGTVCTSSLIRNGAVDTTDWPTWRTQASEALRLPGNLAPLLTNGGMQSGIYSFTISCDNNTSATAALILNSSTQIEI